MIGSSLMSPRAAFPYGHYPIAFVANNDEGTWSFVPPPDTVSLNGLIANLGCDGSGIYGHWLVDVLPRLHRVLEAGHNVDQFLFAGTARAWQLDMLRALDIDLARCHFVDFSKSTVQCDHVVMPTFDRFNSEAQRASVAVHRRLVAKYAADVAPTRRLFVSRKTWGGSRQILNRDEVESVFQEAGFEIVEPQNYPFVDQIRLFASASAVAGETGSGMHNAVFCAPGTHVCLLQSATT